MAQSLYTLPWILSLARASFQSQQGDVKYSVLMQRLWTEMEKAKVPGVIKTPPEQMYSGQPYLYQQAPQPLQELALEAFFYLVRNGYIIERINGDFINEPRADWYRWTARGLRWLAGVEPVPEYVDGYLQFVRSRVPSLDTVVEQYILESITAFERQAYFAAAVMLGAASEKMLYGLGESLLVAIGNSVEKAKLQELFDKRRLFGLLEFIRDAISDAARRRVLPYAVSEGATTHLMTIYEAVRVQRNDAVHPMNASVSEEAIRFLLTAFPYTVEKTEALRLWFSSNALSL